MPLRLAELRRNTDNIVEVKVGLRRALEKCFEGFFVISIGNCPRSMGSGGSKRLCFHLPEGIPDSTGAMLISKSESKVG